jgi:hypothetical protein
MAYLVMEYIEPKTIPAQDAPEKIAKALQWLYDLPAPLDVTIGSVGSRYARYSLFKEFTVSLPFSSMEALEKYMNRVRLCVLVTLFLSIRHLLTMT